MAVKVGGVDALTDASKGNFLSFNPGAYATGSEPTSPVDGDLIYDSDLETIKYWDGTDWVVLGCC